MMWKYNLENNFEIWGVCEDLLNLNVRQCPFFVIQNDYFHYNTAHYVQKLRGKFFRHSFKARRFNYIYLKNGKKKNKRYKIQ
jgi:hypothetical protein